MNLTYIEDDLARRVTFRKISKGYLQKTSELSMLCDVHACSIIYGPYSETPEVWPVEGAREVLTRSINMPQHQQGENQEIFPNERIKKQEEELTNYQTMNHHNDMIRLMYTKMRGEGTSKPSLEELLEIRSISDEKIKEITEWLGKVKLEGNVDIPQDGNGMGSISGSTADPTMSD